MKINISMRGGDTYTARPTLVDQVAFERHFRHDAAVGNAEESPMTFVAYASWHALHRDNPAFHYTWEEFLNETETIAVDDSADTFPDTSSD